MNRGFARRFLVILAASTLAACATTKKTTPELGELLGKKIALVNVEAEDTARKVIEVALVNQLVKSGDFELIDRQSIQEAKTHYAQDSTDEVAVAKRAGADFALFAKALDFSAVERSGYQNEEIQDSQWEKETGEKTRKTPIKVKALDGHVRFELKFVNVQNGDVRTGIAEKSSTFTAEARTQAIRLPPKLRYLENLSNEAFAQFFKDYR